MPTFAVLIRAMPEHMVDQLESHVQDIEGILAETEGEDIIRWTESGTAYSSSEMLRQVLDVIRQKITPSASTPSASTPSSRSSTPSTSPGSWLSDTTR
jgi:hypothetical protein